MSLLQVRLKNCIQTILDLQKILNEQSSDFFEEDFIFLKNCLSRIDKMDLREEEVLLLENCTSEFLSELGQKPSWDKLYNILQ